jgi:hypothetical protein
MIPRAADSTLPDAIEPRMTADNERGVPWDQRPSLQAAEETWREEPRHRIAMARLDSVRAGRCSQRAVVIDMARMRPRRFFTATNP